MLRLLEAGSVKLMWVLLATSTIRTGIKKCRHEISEIFTKFFRDSINAIMQSMDHVIDNNPDYMRNSKAKQSALEMIPFYHENSRRDNQLSTPTS
jgi:hypothetical protein